MIPSSGGRRGALKLRQVAVADYGAHVACGNRSGECQPRLQLLLVGLRRRVLRLAVGVPAVVCVTPPHCLCLTNVGGTNNAASNLQVHRARGATAAAWRNGGGVAAAAALPRQTRPARRCRTAARGKAAPSCPATFVKFVLQMQNGKRTHVSRCKQAAISITRARTKVLMSMRRSSSRGKMRSSAQLQRRGVRNAFVCANNS